MEFNNDLLKSRKLTKGNRRYNLRVDGPEVKLIRSFLKATHEGMLMVIGGIMPSQKEVLNKKTGNESQLPLWK